MKKKAILLVSTLLFGCTTVVKHDEAFATLGQARIIECEQIVYPDGMGEGKEAIGYGCKRYESDGLSVEFAGIVSMLTGWISWPF